MTESALTTALREVVEALEGVAAVALIGGIAVSSRTEPRFTRDVDFMVATKDDAFAELVIRHLVSRRFAIVVTLENTKHGRLGTVRMRRRARAPLIDLLFATSGIELEVVAAAETMTVRGQDIPVARVGHLIALKLLARDDRERPQDLVDLHALSKVADRTEWARAAKAVAMIEKRGFARSKDLVGELEHWRTRNVRARTKVRRKRKP